VQALTGLVSLTLADLLTLMVIVSDNAATNIIIELLGMDRINAFCTEEGLGGTVLRRRMMDAEAISQGLENTTTALDQAKLLDAVSEGSLLAEPLRTFALQTLAAQQFTDALPSLLPDSVQVAHKTGELPGVRHDVGIITAANGRRAVASVLVTGLDGRPDAAHRRRPPSGVTAVIPGQRRDRDRRCRLRRLAGTGKIGLEGVAPA
jgi:beta-lactamase class A